MTQQCSAIRTRVSNVLIYITNFFVSFFICLGMLSLIAYMAYTVWGVVSDALHVEFVDTMKHLARLIILVKAYRILLYYYREHHISITYIVEISIIAPAIELLFTPQHHDLWTNIVLATFALVNLLLYLFFFEKLALADIEECRESMLIDAGKNR